MNLKSIIEETGREFEEFLKTTPILSWGQKAYEMKFFIRESQLRLIDEIVREVEGMKIKRNAKGCYLKGDDGGTYIMDCEYGNCEHAGFNAALQDLLTSLKEARKEIEPLKAIEIDHE